MSHTVPLHSCVMSAPPPHETDSHSEMKCNFFKFLKPINMSGLLCPIQLISWEIFSPLGAKLTALRAGQFTPPPLTFPRPPHPLAVQSQLMDFLWPGSRGPITWCGAGSCDHRQPAGRVPWPRPVLTSGAPPPSWGPATP